VNVAIAIRVVDQKRGKPLASDMGKDSAAVERSGAEQPISLATHE